MGHAACGIGNIHVGTVHTRGSTPRISVIAQSGIRCAPGVKSAVYVCTAAGRREAAGRVLHISRTVGQTRVDATAAEWPGCLSHGTRSV